VAGFCKKMKLLLTSNGFIGNSLEKDFLDLVSNRKNLKIAIIPTASDSIEWVRETPDSKKWVAKLIRPNNAEEGEDYLYFKSNGYDVVIADLKEDSEILKKKLENVDVIDVPGGDVNYLLDWAKIAKLDQYLKDLLDKGIVYVGTSAGTGLVVPDIGLTWWEPKEWAGTDHMGFGIVDFVVVSHQKESDERSNTENLIKRKKYMQSVTDFPWKVYLLQDGQAIKVAGDKIEHIGEGMKKSI
jgi:dipeptidase E